MSMTRKCHNQILPTDQPTKQHREEETVNSLLTSKGTKSKATNSLFPSDMIEKLETTLRTTQHTTTHKTIVETKNAKSITTEG